MRALATLALPLLALLSLAGCSGGSPDEQATPPPDASSYTITVEDFPVAPVPANTTFTFTDRISGDHVRTSDHIGGHFGPNSTQSPSPTVYTIACQHQSGDLPGSYLVTCTAPTMPGTYFLRGHARIIQDNVTTNWWSAEQTFLVA